MTESGIERKKKYLYIGILFMLGMFFYIFAGQEWVSIQDDSVFYLKISGHEGVMPIYPLFLSTLKKIFGKDIYLNVVVILQSLLAIFCTMIFTFYIQRQFRLKNWEGILMYVGCMLPFSIYLPESGITHQILTEGLAYALFYIYFIFILQYIFSKRHLWGIVAAGMSVLMALIRSQLLCLFAITLMAFLFVVFVHNIGKNMSTKIFQFLLSCVIGVGVLFLFVLLVYQIKSAYEYKLMPIIGAWEMEVESSEKQIAQEAQEEIEILEEKDNIKEEQVTSSSLSQFTTLLMIRGFYEVDEEDIELFETPEMQEIFMRVFQAVDEKQYRYVYARQDLYMWKDLICDRITTEAYGVIEEYLRESEQLELKREEIIRELGWKVLLHHFDRYLYHTVRMMIPGFISSVFFQIEPIYLLCHFITLFLYAFAVAGGIICIKKRRNARVAEAVLTTVTFIIAMVIMINLVFFGLQRYMVYAMGIFYCTFYLMAKELLLILCDKYTDKAAWQRIRKLF